MWSDENKTASGPASFSTKPAKLLDLVEDIRLWKEAIALPKTEAGFLIASLE